MLTYMVTASGSMNAANLMNRKLRLCCDERMAHPITAAARPRAATVALLGAIALLLGGCPANNGADGDVDACVTGAPGPTAATVSYANDIRPLFSSNGCLSSGCHGGASASGYDLRNYGASFVPGEQARALGFCAIVPGDPDASYLVQKVLPNPPRGARMPFLREALGDAEIETIRTWIREGAADN